MQFRGFVLPILFAILLVSCQSKTEGTPNDKLAPGIQKVVVNEVVAGKSYTYLRVNENTEEYWLAIASMKVKEDDILYYSYGLEMKDFKSKELDRTFESIYFVSNISHDPDLILTQQAAAPSHGGQSSVKPEKINISPLKGTITLAELFSNKDQYEGQRITIKGKVVKYNAEIMGSNWLHIQDGTSDGENYDITVTTNEVVKVGDVVTIEAKVELNKDFGAGYFYQIILEDGKIQKTSN